MEALDGEEHVVDEIVLDGDGALEEQVLLELLLVPLGHRRGCESGLLDRLLRLTGST